MPLFMGYVKMDSAGMLDIVDRSTWNQVILNSFKWYEHNVYFEKYSVNLNFITSVRQGMVNYTYS